MSELKQVRAEGLCIVPLCRELVCEVGVPFCAAHFNQLDSRDRRRVRKGVTVAIAEALQWFGAAS